MASWTHIDFGYTEKVECWKLQSHLFPSKVGGRPSWLSLKPIPNDEDLKCSECSHPCVFLLQLYAPLAENPDSFHRTLFVFVCRNPNCCKAGENGNFVVLRSNLNRENEFYSYDPPNYNSHNPDDKNPSASDFQPLCILCGCAGKTSCSKCEAQYCSTSHQITDLYRHENLCMSSNDEVPEESPILFPEFRINKDGDRKNNDDIEDDDDDIEDDIDDIEEYIEDDNDDIEEDDEDIEEEFNDNNEGDDNDDKSDALSKIIQFLELVKPSDFSVHDLQQFVLLESNKAFINFKKVVERNPDKIIRHSWGGNAVWITDENQLNQSDVPKCQYCGSERIFEFQVMPQLVAELNVDDVKKSIDWGVVIYTCSKSCIGPEGPNYRKEFLYKQDIFPKQK